MDDLEHSVVIAEHDWESFYEESEECSIQQAWLASLDDSDFSDSDEEKKSTQGPVSDLQPKPDKINKEAGATVQAQSEVDNCNPENTSEEPECLSYKKNNVRCAEQTAEISLKNTSTPCACVTSDTTLSVNFTDQQHSASDNFREHNKSRSEDKACQAIEESITSFPCVQDAGNVGSSEAGTALNVTESSATLKEEKERWFVTVNDNLVKLRVKTGQKKSRKKKTSSKLIQKSKATDRQCFVSNNKKEEEEEGVEIKDGQILQNEFMQPLQSCPESIILGSYYNQQVGSSPMKEPDEEGCEKPSTPKVNCTSEASSFIAKEQNISAFSFKCKDNSDVPKETLESNPPASVISSSPFILPDVQTDAVVNDQSIAKEPKINTQVTTPHHSMTNNLSKTFILDLCSTTSHLEKMQEEAHPTQTQEEIKLPSEKILNHGSQKESLEAAVGPNCPIYALSSFWDEMERLTINDILHLRSAHNRSPMSEYVITEERDIQLEDIGLLTSKHDSVQESDSADSDYFTHVDESKPDSSSGELSTLSDDEEFLQILNRSGNLSPEPQYIKEQTENLKSTYIPGHEFDQNNESESHHIIKLTHLDGIPHYLYPAVEVQSLFLTSSQDSNGNPFELEVIRKTPILSFGGMADNQSMLTFSEIGSSDRLSSSVVSFPVSENLSVSEMYDDFFSDFEVGNFFFPSTQDKTVPIFSASRSAARDLVFPVVEELSFDPDFEEDNMPIRDKTCFSSHPDSSTSPSGIPNLCFSISQRGNWRSLFSLRRIRFIGKGSTWHHKITSWIFPKEAKRTMSFVSRAQEIAPLNNSLLQLAEPQKHAVFISKKDFIFSIKQADMCLVCIAFASWVLKSFNSQSTDMWKAALLANVSAISAIQYLRKYGKGHS